MAMRKAAECKKTDVETLKDILTGEVTTHRAVSNVLRSIEDEAKGRHDNSRTPEEQDKWPEAKV